MSKSPVLGFREIPANKELAHKPVIVAYVNEILINKLSDGIFCIYGFYICWNICF